MTDDLIERLEKTAKTMNGVGSVGASDGMGTTLVGYYDTSCAKLDLEAAQALKAKDEEIARLKEALKPFATWHVLEVYDDTNYVDCTFPAGEIRRARTALGGDDE